MRAVATGIGATLALAMCAAPEEQPQVEFGSGPFFEEIADVWAAAARRSHDDAEQAIARCMTDEGFDYAPVPYQAGGAIGESRADLLEEGFGVFIVVEEDAVVVNPNTAYRASLTAQAAAEYDLALHGVVPREPETDDDARAGTGADDADADGREGAGCYAQGWASLGADPLTEHLPLVEEIHAASRGTLEHPDYLAAMAQWSACMSDAGYPGMTQESDPTFYLQDLMVAELPVGELRAGDPRLGELVALERELAAVHLACLDSSQAYAVRAALVEIAQREVMERRAAEVTAYITALHERAAS